MSVIKYKEWIKQKFNNTYIWLPSFTRLNIYLVQLRIWTCCRHWCKVAIILWLFWICILNMNLLLFLFMLYDTSIFRKCWTNVLRYLNIKSQLQFPITRDFLNINLLICDISSFNAHIDVHLVLLAIIWDRLSANWLSKVLYMIQNGQKKKFLSWKLKRNISNKFFLIKAI